jgi:DNA-binding transcriptional MocR family regulator
VVYTSTFSKILAPGMRIGWIVMPDWLAQQTVIVKQAADLHTNMLSQVITAEYLSMNRLDNQIALIREDYRKKCVALADALESRLGEHLEFSRPQGDVPVGAFPLSVRYHGMDEENAGKRRGLRSWRSVLSR